ncbi:MAG: tetratricopeptide repeat protein [Bacteroidales bacterium]
MKKLAVFLLMLPALQSMAQTPSELVEQGNQSYTRGEYSNAAAHYEKVLEMGWEAPELYYNLGNAYYKMNQIPGAILNYERGLRLRPGDKALRYNLDLAREKLTDRIDPIPPLFYEKWWTGFLQIQSADAWAKTGLFLVSFFLGCVLWFFFARTVVQKKSAFVLGVILLFLASLALLSANRQYRNQYLKKEAVLFVPRVSAKSGPGANNPDLFVIHAGTKATITNELNEWAEIQLPNGNLGWVRKETLEVI